MRETHLLTATAGKLPTLEYFVSKAPELIDIGYIHAMKHMESWKRKLIPD